MSREPRPSDSVMVVQDREALEALGLQRGPRKGEIGARVFPGGKTEEAERP